MGVAGLWDIIRPVGEIRSLTHLAVVDGFEANPDGVRGFRVGIDASIWFYHATYGREGENPELRTLFFKCTRLMYAPFLPLFVFDGPKRPEFKRGKRISGKNHWMIQGMQKIIDAFGFEWRMAPGEAEAELAYLNRIGVIDAVLTDDVDTFLFGAKMIVRNPSVTLSGNRAHSLKNSAGRDDGNHVATYAAYDILHNPSVQLTQGGLILIGILRGGDYHQAGLPGCGGTIAHGLAKCGFGDTLLEAARKLSRDELPGFLRAWREELRVELRTNSRGHIGRKHPSLAKSIPEDFPNIDVLLNYTHPITTEAKGPLSKKLKINWEKEPDLGKIAELCELYFEWGVKEIIIKRFRTVLWPAAVLRILRRAALLRDKTAAKITTPSGIPMTPTKSGKQRQRVPGTPSSMITKHFSSLRLDTATEETALNSDDEDEGNALIIKIHSSRKHASTDGVLEYRLEIAPGHLVRLCEAGIKGMRKEVATGLESDEDEADDSDDGAKDKKTKKSPPDPHSHLRIWLPACMVRLVEPELVEDFEEIEEIRQAKKAGKASKDTRGPHATKSKALSKPKASKKKITSVLENECLSSDDSVSPRPTKPTSVKTLSKSKCTAPAMEPSDSGGDREDVYGNISSKRGDTVRLDKFKTKMSSRAALGPTLSAGSEVFPLLLSHPYKPNSKKPVKVVTVLTDSSDEESADHGGTSSSSRLLSLTASSRTSFTASTSSAQSRLNNTCSALNSRPEVRAELELLRHRFVPAPFPMSPEVNNDSDQLDSMLKSSYTHSCQRSPLSSDSACANSPVQRSPRRSKLQSSPRSTYSVQSKDNDSDTSVVDHTGSPTPRRGRPVAPTKRSLSPTKPVFDWKLDNSVIEISSNSDSDISSTQGRAKPTKVAPLLIAQAKSKSRKNGMQLARSKTNQTKKAQTVSRSTIYTNHLNPHDVIDLT